MLADKFYGQLYYDNLKKVTSLEYSIVLNVAFCFKVSYQLIAEETHFMIGISK